MPVREMPCTSQATKQGASCSPWLLLPKPGADHYRRVRVQDKSNWSHYKANETTAQARKCPYFRGGRLVDCSHNNTESDQLAPGKCYGSGTCDLSERRAARGGVLVKDRWSILTTWKSSYLGSGQQKSAGVLLAPLRSWMISPSSRARRLVAARRFTDHPNTSANPLAIMKREDFPLCRRR
jgi:hypothetical protein